MLFLYPLILLLFGFSEAITECDVYPCSRDIITVIDSTSDMETDDNVGLQIDFLKSVIRGWDFGNNGSQLSRMAIVGNGVLDLIDTTAYMQTEADIVAALDSMRVKASQYGLTEVPFYDLMTWIYKKYNSNYPYPARENVQRRIVIFTPVKDITKNLAKSQKAVNDFRSLGFEITIVAINGNDPSIFQSLGVHKMLSIPTLSSIPSTFPADLISQAICFDTSPSPVLCPTRAPPSVPPTAISTLRPTNPPLPQGDYLNCSCTRSAIWLDIVVMIDVSKSMGYKGLLEVQADIATLIGWLTIDPTVDQTSRIGIVTFAKRAKVQATLNEFKDKDAIIDFLFNLKHTDEEGVDILDAFQMAERAMEKSGEDRKNARNVYLLYSSAYRENGEDSPVAIATQLRESGNFIITVAFEQSDQSATIERIGKLATPGMNFTSKQHPLNSIVDALCQANCYCNNNWHQLTLNERRFAECYFYDNVNVGWSEAQKQCAALDAHENSQLIYVNSLEKHQLIQTYVARAQGNSTVNYHVGLSFDRKLNKYRWTTGVVDLPYTNWDTGYPNNSHGDCVKAAKISGFNVKWQNEDCSNSRVPHVCQAQACDSDHYCP